MSCSPHLDLPALARQLDQALGDASGEAESLGVDVDEREGALIESVDGEDVGHQLAGEDGAARPDEGDLAHER